MSSALSPTGPASCACGAPCSAVCAECATPACDLHRDAVDPSSLRGIRLADPAELAVWEWATTLDCEAMSAAEHKPDRGERCTVCRARHGQSALTAVRALPGEDGMLTRQVAAVRTGWTIDALYAEPVVGLGVAAAAWLTSHRVRTTTVITGWVHRGPTAFRPYTITAMGAAWLVEDPDLSGARATGREAFGERAPHPRRGPDPTAASLAPRPTHDRVRFEPASADASGSDQGGYRWVVTPNGRIGLAPRQGVFVGRSLYGAPRHAAGSTITYEISWGSSIARATKRVATALAQLPEVPVDPGPQDWPVDGPGVRTRGADGLLQPER